MTAHYAHDEIQRTDLRPADEVMRLERIGSFFPTRLSFMRTLIRRLAHERSHLKRPVWEMDADGYGRAVYSIDYGGHTYSLIAFSTRLDPENRTDRVIAEAWDASFVLFDGLPTREDIHRNQENAPKQEAGRFTDRELTLSRANKSVRIFDHTVDALAGGRQPRQKMVRDIGYLMRTTAVYGNGKFGIADRTKTQHRKHMSAPFQAEMLTVWLIRTFSHDLVEHVAKMKNPTDAVRLAKNIKRHLGIGNSTGLGMAPFLVNHPVLLNNWMMVRETALARVRATKKIDPHVTQKLVQRATSHLLEWNVQDHLQTKRILQLREDWGVLHKDRNWMSKAKPWDALFAASRLFGLECQELTVALALEANGPLIDGLADCMDCGLEPQLNPSMSTSEITQIIKDHAAWALKSDFTKTTETAKFWYVSAEKLEPRLGDRYNEPGAEKESPLDVARQIQNLAHDLHGHPKTSVAEFLMTYPQHRRTTRRLQILARFPYAEIRDNMISDKCKPIDMLRCKLSFFGASKFDPKSDRWTRITLYQGAPLHDELGEGADDWWLPCFAP